MTELPQFAQQTGFAVRVIAVGSSQALEIGRRGDADVLLTHAPEAISTWPRVSVHNVGWTAHRRTEFIPFALRGTE